jgi:hypothetical protein
MWVNWAGSNFTSEQVVFILNATGSSYTVETLETEYRIGAVFYEGRVWFQRLS